MKSLLAVTSNPFGQVKPPVNTGLFSITDPGQAIGSLIEKVLQILIIGAGLYTLFNLVIAGYDFLSAGDDPKKVAGTWAKIWQSLLGLAVAAGAFVLAAIFGQLVFGQWDFILNPQIQPIQ